MTTVGVRLLTAGLGLGCLLGLIHILGSIGAQIPLDPNEGWNAYFTQALLATGSPYPPATSLMINNYPPLSFYVVAAVTPLTGDAIIAGRWVALIALAAVGAETGLAAIRMGCDRRQAALAALFFVAVVMATTDYAGMDDPQMLAHAVALGGMLLVLRERPTPRDMVGAALAFAVALFVKHNLVVLPAAAALWLALLDRRLAITFVFSGIVFVLLGMGLFRDAFGIGLFQQVASPRTYSFADLSSGISAWLTWSAIPLAGTALLFGIARRDRYAVFCAIYAVLGTLAGAYFLGGAGVDANAMFDADIALALSAAMLLSRLGDGWRQNGASAVYAAMFLSVVLSVDADWRNPDFWRHPAAEERAAAAQDITLIRNAKGPAICEMLSLCYWAGKEASVDVFNIGEAFRAHARNDSTLLRDIDAGRYEIIELENDEPFPLTPAIAAALAEHYRITRQEDDRRFYAPNRAP